MPAFPRTNRGKAGAAVCQPYPTQGPLSHPRAKMDGMTDTSRIAADQNRQIPAWVGTVGPGWRALLDQLFFPLFKSVS